MWRNLDRQVRWKRNPAKKGRTWFEGWRGVRPGRKRRVRERDLTGTDLCGFLFVYSLAASGEWFLDGFAVRRSLHAVF